MAIKVGPISFPDPGDVLGFAERVARENVEHLDHFVRGSAETAVSAAELLGLVRTQMDERGGSNPVDGPQALVKDPEEAFALFERRLVEAQAFLAERGLEGRLVARMLTADNILVLSQTVSEHAEWHLLLLPELPSILEEGAHPWIDESALDQWLRAQGVAPDSGTGIIRSHDNPLFLLRLNFGHGGAGAYRRVPMYAELGGQRWRAESRRLELVVELEPRRARSIIDRFYRRLPGAYDEQGCCHQGAMVVADELGLADEAAKRIKGLPFTARKYGWFGERA